MWLHAIRSKLVACCLSTRRMITYKLISFNNPRNFHRLLLLQLTNQQTFKQRESLCRFRIFKFKSLNDKSDSKVPATPSSCAWSVQRQFNGGEDNEDDERYRRHLKLMDFEEIRWPSLWKSFRNRWFALLISKYYDQTFTMDGFIEGAVQAIVHVSSMIAEGNFSDLQGLVEDKALEEVKRNYACLDLAQRRFIAVSPKDIFWKFIYEIGMMFDDRSDKRFVEITVVAHGLHGFHEAKETNPMNSYNDMREFHDQFYTCNYRLIREFTKGVESDWTINKLNHCKSAMN